MDAVDDAKIQEPTDAIVRITSTAICWSDLHLYTKLGPVMEEGDMIGHEPKGNVEEVGDEVPGLGVGDRVVVPFNKSLRTGGGPFRLHQAVRPGPDRGHAGRALPVRRQAS